MSRLRNVWIRAVIKRVTLIQVIAIALVAVVDGAERFVAGDWHHWSFDVFRLHLVGLGLYFVLAVLWTDRDWRLGGEWLAFQIAGYSKQWLFKSTIVAGFCWASFWLGFGYLVEGPEAEIALVQQGAEGQESTWVDHRFMGDRGLSVLVDGSVLTHVWQHDEIEPPILWGQDLQGRWVGLEAAAVPEPKPSAPKWSLGQLLMACCRSISVAIAAGVCLWFRPRYAWLAVVLVAATSLFETGVQSAVLRGFWPLTYVALVPFTMLLVAIVASRASGVGGRATRP